jgi:hypothetical protein
MLLHRYYACLNVKFGSRYFHAGTSNVVEILYNNVIGQLLVNITKPHFCTHSYMIIRPHSWIDFFSFYRAHTY